MNPQNIEIMGDDCTNQAWSEKSNSKEAIVENLKNVAKILIESKLLKDLKKS